MRDAGAVTKWMIVGVALVSASCGSSPELRPFEQAGKGWPPPPDEARIQFVREFSTPKELGIRSGLLDAILSFSSGGSDDRLVKPMSVAASADGKTVYVGDSGAECVHRYDLARGRHACLRNRGEGGLPAPVGLALASDGGVYVSDSHLGRILYAEPGATYLLELEMSRHLARPTGIALDEAHARLFVVDTGSHSIKAFSTAGELEYEFGRRGNSPGEFNFPTAIWLNGSGELLITDSLNFVIQKFDGRGNYLGMFGGPGDRPGWFARPKGVASDSEGNIYVMDGLFNAMQIFSRDGELLLALGNRGHGEGQFWLPVGIFIDGRDTIFVADSFNRRVQVFRYVGGRQ